MRSTNTRTRTVTLIIIVNVPLTVGDLTAPMNIWQVHTFPLLSFDEGTDHTELTGTPKFIIYNNANKYYAVANDRQNLKLKFEFALNIR